MEVLSYQPDELNTIRNDRVDSRLTDLRTIDYFRERPDVGAHIVENIAFDVYSRLSGKRPYLRDKGIYDDFIVGQRNKGINNPEFLGEREQLSTLLLEEQLSGVRFSGLADFVDDIKRGEQIVDIDKIITVLDCYDQFKDAHKNPYTKQFALEGILNQTDDIAENSEADGQSSPIINAALLRLRAQSQHDLGDFRPEYALALTKYAVHDLHMAQKFAETAIANEPDIICLNELRDKIEYFKYLYINEQLSMEQELALRQKSQQEIGHLAILQSVA